MNEATKKLIEGAEKRAGALPRAHMGGAMAVGYSLVGEAGADVLALCAEVRKLDEERSKEREAWREYVAAKDAVALLPVDVDVLTFESARERHRAAAEALSKLGAFD